LNPLEATCLARVIHQHNTSTRYKYMLSAKPTTVSKLLRSRVNGVESSQNRAQPKDQAKRASPMCPIQAKPSQAHGVQPTVSSVMVRVRSYKPSLHVKSAYGVKSSSQRCQVNGVQPMVSSPRCHVYGGVWSKRVEGVCQVQVCQAKSV